MNTSAGIVFGVILGSGIVVAGFFVLLRVLRKQAEEQTVVF